MYLSNLLMAFTLMNVTCIAVSNNGIIIFGMVDTPSALVCSTAALLSPRIEKFVEISSFALSRYISPARDPGALFCFLRDAYIRHVVHLKGEQNHICRIIQGDTEDTPRSAQANPNC